MNSRKTLFLLVLVALGAGFVVWDHFKGTTTEALQEKSKRLLDVQQKDVTGLELIRSNQTIAIRRAGDNWEITQPLTARADGPAVESILTELEFAERTRRLAGDDLRGLTAAEMGLEKPVNTIRLQRKQGPVTLKVGSETPTHDAVYVQVEGETAVSVVGKGGFERQNLTLDALRHRAVINFTPAATTRLEIKATDRAIELVRSGTVWAITRPLAARADQGKVSELLADLSQLRVQEFVSDEPKDVHVYQLDEPDREVTLYTGDAGKTLLLGKSPTNDATKVYAKLKGGNSIVTIPVDVAKKFAAPVNDLRDRRVLVFDPAAVKSIQLSQTTIERDGTGWKITGANPVAAETEIVDRFLQHLAGLRVKEFVADVTTRWIEYGLEPRTAGTPPSRIMLGGEGTNVLAELWLSPPTPERGERSARLTGEPFVYLVESNAWDELNLSEYNARTRKVLELKPTQVTKLSAGEVMVQRDAQGKWKLVTPPEGVLDVDAVNAILNTLANLRAETFGNRTSDEAYRIAATVGETNHVVSLYKDGMAAVTGVPLDFRLAPATVETLTKKLVTAPAKP